MWCLETIVAINNAAQSRHDSGSNPLQGFADAGVFIPQSLHLKKKKNNGKKRKSSRKA